MNYPAILTIILLSCLSCHSVKPTTPVYQPQARTFTPTASSIAIPVEIKLELLRDQINRKFSGLLYNDESYTQPTKDDLKLKVYINRKITINATGNQLRFTIPLSIHAAARWSACTICPELEGKTSFELDAFMTSSVAIGNNYDFALSSKAGDFVWTTAPFVQIGPLKIPIARLLEDILRKQLQKVATEIDQSVNKSIDLRAMMQTLWNTTSEPFLLDDSTQTWLTIKPQNVLLSPIQGNNERIRMNIGVRALIETVTGSKPPAVKPGQLPQIATGIPNDERFHIHIYSGIGFDKTTEIASRMNGYEFSEGKRKVRIENINIYGVGEKAYIKLLLAGAVRGEVYLSGIPRYNSLSDELYFDALDFDINTRNVLMKSASWLLKGAIQNKLKQTLRFSFSSEINQLRKTIRESLNTISYKDLLTINGTLENFVISDILIKEDKFVLIFEATGQAKINIH